MALVSCQYAPCFQRARRLRSNPSGVRRPVLTPRPLLFQRKTTPTRNPASRRGSLQAGTDREFPADARVWADPSLCSATGVERPNASPLATTDRPPVMNGRHLVSRSERTQCRDAFTDTSLAVADGAEARQQLARRAPLCLSARRFQLSGGFQAGYVGDTSARVRCCARFASPSFVDMATVFRESLPSLIYRSRYNVNQAGKELQWIMPN